ncbi:MAG TPA: methyltransferase domain-containing protein [Vicinamibacterales bacterium]|jgi:ubiquinone/menaquinone biosynthesis C-methylase UbiE
MFKWFRRSTLDPLSVSMVGAKLADRVLIAGASDVRFIAAIAAKAGLTGRTCIVDESSERANEAEQAALREGALVESFTAPYHALPFEPETFDIVVVRSTAASTGAAFEQARRVLRGGGRCMVVHPPPQGGISALLDDLKRAGFVAVRTLAEREGLAFVEAVKRSD